MIIKPLYPKNGEGFHLKSNSLKKIKCLARVYRQCLTSSLIMAHEITTTIIFPLFSGAMASLGWVLTEEEDRKIALRRRRLQERALRIGNPWNTTIAVNYIHSMHSRATWHNCIDFIYSTILYNVECFVCKGFIKFIQYKFNNPSLRLKSNSGRYHCTRVKRLRMF